MIGEDDALAIVCLAGIFQFFASFFSWKLTVGMVVVMCIATLMWEPSVIIYAVIFFSVSILFYHWCPWHDFRNKNSCRIWGGYAVKGRIVREYDKGWYDTDSSSFTRSHFSNYHYVVEFLDCDGKVTRVDQRIPGFVQWSGYDYVGGPEVIIVKICGLKKRIAIIDKAPSPETLRKFQNGIFFGPMTMELNSATLRDNPSRRAKYGSNLPPAF